MTEEKVVKPPEVEVTRGYILKIRSGSESSFSKTYKEEDEETSILKRVVLYSLPSDLRNKFSSWRRKKTNFINKYAIRTWIGAVVPEERVSKEFFEELKKLEEEYYSIIEEIKRRRREIFENVKDYFIKEFGREPSVNECNALVPPNIDEKLKLQILITPFRLEGEEPLPPLDEIAIKNIEEKRREAIEIFNKEVFANVRKRLLEIIKYSVNILKDVKSRKRGLVAPRQIHKIDEDLADISCLPFTSDIIVSRSIRIIGFLKDFLISYRRGDKNECQEIYGKILSEIEDLKKISPRDVIDKEIIDVFLSICSE
ncbi:MAG: hypothetical protein B6U95_00105 [Thermofilum sp. ex4484_82]|nr:MAG: hypothetical protein B6U95_00105 [Thermofilum sp. ex4484_82]OYT40132.1 MAG: hypothetical protein B6U96_00105 [Archaeoglobales archaeon ex4484_92]